MKQRVLFVAACLSIASACRESPVDSPVSPPGKIANFAFLYARNCAGCHGTNGKGGVAVSLSDPVYLAIADDRTIVQVTSTGVPGTSMPAFAEHSGGMLTDEQIAVIMRGIRAWAQPDTLRDANPPPYAAQIPGDPASGAAVYEIYCKSCHGAGGRGGRASSIVDNSYLALVSDQNLRTTVIVGRPEMGAPDWRGNLLGKPMSPQEVSDVVAWLSAQRGQPKQEGANE
jgi:cytochrome c oxidase cbb3-type subunit III